MEETILISFGLKVGFVGLSFSVLPILVIGNWWRVDRVQLLKPAKRDCHLHFTLAVRFTCGDILLEVGSFEPSYPLGEDDLDLVGL